MCNSVMVQFNQFAPVVFFSPWSHAHTRTHIHMQRMESATHDTQVIKDHIIYFISLCDLLIQKTMLEMGISWNRFNHSLGLLFV